MPPSPLAKLCSPRVHYAWVARAVTFSVTLAVVGVRAAPGVMIVPLQRAFGWNVGTISGAVSPNILLMGLTGPFLTGLMESIGLKRTILLALGVLVAGSGASSRMTTPWQLYLTWGLMIGVGAGAVRGLTGSYMLAFLASGLACLLASSLVLRIARTPALAIAAE
jgi:hypothetical protein